MPKGDISRRNLQRHGIRYEEHVYQVPDVSTQSTSRPLPDHVDAVREALLSFEGTLAEEWKKDLREELDNFKDPDDLGPTWTHLPPDAAFIRVHHYERAFQERNTENNIAHENLKWSQEIAICARQLLEEPEPEWNHFWRTKVFLQFDDKARKQSGFNYESVLWNEFAVLLKPLKNVKRRTQPKPDLTYAFPMQVLSGLIPHGVSCVPTTGLRNWTNTNVREKTILRGSDRSCFPWAVVEMKRDAATPDQSTKKCYCQAANAAAAALELQAQLFDKLGETSPELPPVVAFTCIGPNVKVWLAYQDQTTKSKKRTQTDLGSGIATFHYPKHAHVGFTSIEAQDPSLCLSILSVSPISDYSKLAAGKRR
ncbi:hypothetical protein EJ02DRAFT_513093 [Clathrospora elynae]|uniref:Uncharacterized protein n=1 Tax=Clathrospora elynae TaxID=706981 RepID=A0A6A5SKW1_9PLEO|nr:hypothetical protein EJ02DRAFT_513093 [Clathrospora elynae]